MTDPADPAERSGALRRTLPQLLVIAVLGWAIHLLFNWAMRRRVSAMAG